MDDLKFSVSMCVYGGDNSKWFDTSLESVFNQSLFPTEVVLFVDGSIPRETQNVIEKYKTKYDCLKVIYSEKNVGHGNARRNCMEACSHDLIALMDADDICVPDRFEKQIEAFKINPKISIVGGQISEFIDSADNIVGKRVVPLNDSEIKQYMRKRCPMNQMTVMFRKKDVLKVGGYLDWYCDEDYYLWIRMALEGLLFENIDEVLVKVRVGREMYSRRGGIKYFNSEAKLQKYMLDKKIIGFTRFAVNVCERLVLQVLMPNKIRGFIFKVFARQGIKKYE